MNQKSYTKGIIKELKGGNWLFTKGSYFTKSKKYIFSYCSYIIPNCEENVKFFYTYF